MKSSRHDVSVCVGMCRYWKSFFENIFVAFDLKLSLGYRMKILDRKDMEAYYGHHSIVFPLI